jgi:MinD-like ATPase involved in chromosome partitioning or flagellar assembly
VRTFDASLDQASGLRRLFRPRALRLLPVVSDPRPGLSSVFALNLAAALRRAGARPIVIDAHREGVPALAGLDVRRDLRDLLEGTCRVDQVLRTSPEGLAVLPARHAAGALLAQPGMVDAVFSAIASIRDGYDVALFHAPATLLGRLLPERGVDFTVLCGLHEEDLTATYAWLKMMVRDFGLTRFRVVFDAGDAESEVAVVDMHRRLARAAARFLEAEVGFGGAVWRDPEVEEALRVRASVFAVDAEGPSARAFERIAACAHEWRLPAFAPAERTIH